MTRAARLVVVVVAAIAVGVTAREAAARRVGFANVAHDGAAGQAAIAAVRAPVAEAGRLEDLGDGPARQALESPVDPSALPESVAVARARKLLAAAKDALTGFEYDAALDRLRQADATLRAVAPSPEVVAALADLNLLAGLVHAGRGDEARALEAFRLVRRLAPDRKALDPAAYRPAIVALYEQAGRADGASGVVFVTTEPAGATVWVDGRAVGVAPVELPALGVGEHYLAATLDGHAPRVERVRVEAGRRLEQSFLLARLPPEERARAVRAALLRPGVVEADWAPAAATLADVASLDVLVMVRQRESGGLEGAVYDVRAGALGAWVPLDDPKALVDSVPRPPSDPIAVPTPRDVARRTPDGRPPPPPPPPPARPWYRTFWGMSALIGGGVLAAAVVIAIGSSGGAGTTTYEGGCCVWSD